MIPSVAIPDTIIFFGQTFIWKPWDDFCYIFILEVDLADVQEEGEGTNYQNADWGFQRPLFVDGWKLKSGGKLKSAALFRICNDPGKEEGFQDSYARYPRFQIEWIFCWIESS